MKNYGFRNFRTFKNNLTTGFSQKNQPGCISTAILRFVKRSDKSNILIHSEFYKKIQNLPVFCLPASLPAVDLVPLGVWLQIFHTTKVITLDLRKCCSD